MKKVPIAVIAVMLLVAGFGQKLFAEGPKGAPTPQETAPMELASKDINDALIDDFLRADQKIREVQIKANREIFQILDQEKLSVAKYNGIVQAISRDSGLLKRVHERLSKMLEKQKSAEAKKD